MKLATERRMTLEEFLEYDDGTDTRYELEDGVLVEMGTENPINNAIVLCLIYAFQALGLPSYQLATAHLLGTHPVKHTGRVPDFIVHTEASADAIYDGGKFLAPGMPPPMMVVEVVSSSDTDKKSRKRDYEEKRAEYAARGIGEYWIVDPIADVVLVLNLEGSEYQEQRFTGEMAIDSPTFPELNLTVDVLLRAGRPLGKSQASSHDPLSTLNGGDRP
jgi:Uma2 family endonuclease